MEKENFLIPESSKKQNLNLLHSSNYLHSIFIYIQLFASVNIVLGILSNLEMI